jgi:anti-anti-sigma factor
MNTQSSHDRPFLRLVPPLTPAGNRWRHPRPALAPAVDHGTGDPQDDHGCSLNVTHRDKGSVWIMTLAGEADLTTRDELDRGLAHALSGTAGVLVVDVAELDFCDSLCATAVIEANCNTPDTQMVLVGGHGMVSRVFDLLDPAQTLARHE